MATTERALARGNRRAERNLREFGVEVLETRLTAAISQIELGRRVGFSGTKVSRAEAGLLRTLSIHDATRLAAVLGFDLVLRLYPYGPRLRDEGHVRRLGLLLQHVAPPLTCRTEVPLPRRADAIPELRSWDAMLLGHGARTAIEMEMRLRDAQALERRIAAKRRDDAVDGFLLLVADTPANRRTLAEHPELFPDLPRLRRSRVLRDLKAGAHPPTGLMLI